MNELQLKYYVRKKALKHRDIHLFAVIRCIDFLYAPHYKTELCFVFEKIRGTMEVFRTSKLVRTDDWRNFLISIEIYLSDEKELIKEFIKKDVYNTSNEFVNKMIFKQNLNISKIWPDIILVEEKDVLNGLLYIKNTCKKSYETLTNNEVFESYNQYIKIHFGEDTLNNRLISL